MKKEILRQLVHLSGILFVILAQLIGNFIIVWFFVVAATLLAYSSFVRRQETHISLISKLEAQIRKAAYTLERKDTKKPFIGAFWFFFACGVSFLIFPLAVASAACTILAIGDAFSTLVGKKFGRIRIIGKKTLEGSAAFWIGGLVSAVWIAWPAAVVGAAAAAFSELVPDLPVFRKLKEKQILDDNWLIPIISGAVMWAVLLIL